MSPHLAPEIGEVTEGSEGLTKMLPGPSAALPPPTNLSTQPAKTLQGAETKSYLFIAWRTLEEKDRQDGSVRKSTCRQA